MASSQFIHIGAGFDLFSEGAAPRADRGTPLNAGACTWALAGADGHAVPGGTGSLAYTAGSGGGYLGHIPASATALLAEDANYGATLTFTSGGATDVRAPRLKARKRGRS